MSHIFPGLPDEYVKTRHIGPGAVTEPKIGANAVTQSEIISSAVGQGELKTSNGSVSASSDIPVNLTLPGGAYGFYPQLKSSLAGHGAYGAIGYVTAVTYMTTLRLDGGTAYTQYARQYYVTASGEVHWIFILIDKATGKSIATWQAPDHPCFGNRGILHPFCDYDPAKHEILVVNPLLSDVENILTNCIPSMDGGYLTKEKLALNIQEDFSRGKKDFLEVFDEMFDINTAAESVWPGEPITIGLPSIINGKIADYRLMAEEKIVSVKAIIQKPAYITALKYKQKEII